jgi:diketogulonate reductase-like aldo/keto reductase
VMEAKHFKLGNCAEIPFIGYGTGVVNHYTRNRLLWIMNKTRNVLSSIKHLKVSRQLRIDLFASQMVREAYDTGFRLFDTGRLYGYSEIRVGEGLANIPRKDYFITTKISDLNLEQAPPPPLNGDNKIVAHLRKSLEYLRTDYVDLLLIHHPHGPIMEIYAGMEEAYRLGLAKAIGTSNFTVKDFEELKRTQTIAPMVNQGERHPFFTNTEVLNYCREHGILFNAHTPVARNRDKTRNNELLKSLSQKYKKTVAQIILRWHYQNGVVPIVSVTNALHMRESLDIFDFSLTHEEISKIEGLNENYRMLDCENGVDDPLYVYNL